MNIYTIIINMERLHRDLRKHFDPDIGDYCTAIAVNNALIIIESNRTYIYNKHAVTGIWIKQRSHEIKVDSYTRSEHISCSTDFAFVRRTIELALLADTIEVVKIASSHKRNFQKLLGDNI